MWPYTVLSLNAPGSNKGPTRSIFGSLESEYRIADIDICSKGGGAMCLTLLRICRGG